MKDDPIAIHYVYPDTSDGLSDLMQASFMSETAQRFMDSGLTPHCPKCKKLLPYLSVGQKVKMCPECKEAENAIKIQDEVNLPDLNECGELNFERPKRSFITPDQINQKKENSNLDEDDQEENGG